MFANVDLSNAQTQFSPPIRIEFEYPDGNQDGLVDGTSIHETALAIFYLDESAGKMTAIAGCAVDPVANRVGVDVSHFTVFGLYTSEMLSATNWALYE